MKNRRMRTISVFSQKGGSGKSTIGIHVSVEASKSQKTALIDADGQGTGQAWASGRAKDEPAVVAGAPSNIRDLLASAEAEGYELAIVDCPPHINAGASELVSVADLVVVPVQPTFPDMAALNRALSVISAAGRPFVFVLNRADKRSPETRDAIETLSRVGPVCPEYFGDRKAFGRALSSGLAVCEFTSNPDDKAASEARAVYQWLMESMQ
ncbi:MULTISPECIES: ParA family protein [Pseudomonadota]|uniref:ParA family protein n=3 Tax=Pseudomonadota TaxID=1224 RepID=UPI000896165C|nr:chromosome partitioning protein [Burkholderia sp. WP9]SEP48079.1 chromosome partitioning protein [Pseudomonas sp. Snoq117.2]